MDADRAPQLKASVSRLVTFMKSRLWHASIIGSVALLVVATFPAEGRSQRRTVPKEFSYPEASETVQIALTAKSLSGSVSIHGEALADALVERVDKSWERRIDAAFTDAAGRFQLSSLTDGKYFLKISKSGYCTLRVKVTLKRKAKSVMDLELPPGI